MKLDDWLNEILVGVPDNIIAFNFNLFETEKDNQYGAQLVGSSTYSLDDEDWACNTEYTSGENVFVFISDDWEEALSLFISFIKNYLRLADKTDKLNSAEYVTAGFVDGDLEIIMQKCK